MPISLGNAFIKNFLGKAPDWYKVAIIAFLIINPIVFFLINPFVAGWFVGRWIYFTLAMALKCYPLQPGGLLAIEAIAIGMTSPAQVKHELVANIEVLLLLVFMVAGIYFMKQLLLFIFTKFYLAFALKPFYHSRSALLRHFCLHFWMPWRLSPLLSAWRSAFTLSITK